jgi:hypothetical protein
MKKLLIAATLALPLMASAQNLLSNGSFESGALGWTSTSSAGTVYPPQVITYGPPPSAFGETIPADNAASLSPDAVGIRGLYFVDDNTTQTLSQTFTVPSAGSYTFGFSAYLPSNGFANPGNAVFSGTMDSFPLFSGSLNTGTPAVWTAFSDVGFLTAGSHTLSFSFVTTGGFSKDLVIDRVYVTAVPEAGTLAMLLAGLGVVGSVARRRSRG